MSSSSQAHNRTPPCRPAARRVESPPPNDPPGNGPFRNQFEGAPTGVTSRRSTSVGRPVHPGDVAQVIVAVCADWATGRIPAIGTSAKFESMFRGPGGRSALALGGRDFPVCRGSRLHPLRPARSEPATAVFRRCCRATRPTRPPGVSRGSTTSAITWAWPPACWRSQGNGWLTSSFTPNSATSRCAEPHRIPGSRERRAARPRERTWLMARKEGPGAEGKGRPCGLPNQAWAPLGRSPAPPRPARPRRRLPRGTAPAQAHSTISTPRMMRQWPGKVQR